MKSYNGFPPEQRDKAQRWLRSEWASGRLKRPSQCCACSQAQGVIDAHAEDYSLPFAAGKTDGYHLCFNCHMIVHCRFRNRTAWDRYRNSVRGGGHFAARLTRDFGSFAAELLDGEAAYQRALTRFTPGPPPARLVLDEIEALNRSQVAESGEPAHLAKRPDKQADLFSD